MRLSEINQVLLQEIIRDEHGAQHRFNELKVDIEKYSFNPLSITNGIRVNKTDQDLIVHVMLSVLLSDMTRIYPNFSFLGQFKPDKSSDIDKEGIHQFLADEKIEIHKEEGAKLSLMNTLFSDGDAEFLKDNLQPLFEKELVTLSLSEHVMAQYKSEKEENHIHILPVELDTLSRLWSLPKGGAAQTKIPINHFDDSIAQNPIIDNILVPFIQGISTGDFVKIIEDENDLISSFRTEIKAIRNSVFEKKLNLAEAYNDCVRPKIEKINRRFTSVSNIHKFKVRGVVVATATLSLLSMLVGNYIGAAGTMISAATGSAGLIKFEAEFQNEAQALKDDPLYLLWRFKTQKR